jgi:hypothetical protein
VTWSSSRICRRSDGQFVLPVSHANCNSIYSLALASAINRYTVRVRTTEDIEVASRRVV